MATVSVGPGEAAEQTTRVVAATDSPEVEALGTPSDAPAVTAADDASVVSLLKAVFDQQQETAAAILAELRRTRIGLQLILANMGIEIDLETE